MDIAITQANLTMKGGAEKIVLRMAQHYKAKIYTAEYDKNTTFPEFSDLDVEVIGTRTAAKILPYSRATQGLNYGMSFYRFVIKEDYDVINAHIAPSHWIRNINERVVWYCHTPLRELYDLYSYRQKFRKVWSRPVYKVGASFVRKMDYGVVKKIEFIFANSENTRSRIKKYFGRDDAVVLNGAVDYQNYLNGGDDKYFLYPARISPNKRQDYAIRAFEIFRKISKSKGYRLILVGPVSKDSFYQEYYRRIMEISRAAKGIEVRTEVNDKELIDLYSRCTAVIYPPLNEDYGLVPLEAMASGKPIIAVNEGGPRETVIDGKTGFLAGSEAEMAKRMAMVAENEDLAAKLGKSGRAHVKKNYSWNRFFESFEKEARKVAKM